MKFFLIVICVSISLYSQEFSTSTMRPMNLNEAFNLSLKRSEMLASKKEYIKELEAQEKSLTSNILPKISFNINTVKKEDISLFTKGYLSTNYQFFSGMKDYIAIKAMGDKQKSASMLIEDAKRNLYMDVVEAYWNLFNAQKVVGIFKEKIELDNKRIDELKKRVKIGRSRESEVVSAVSQLMQDKASYLDSILNERISQEIIKFLTGVDYDIVPVDYNYDYKNYELSYYLEMAKKRPDIESKRLDVSYYRRMYEGEKNNFYPSIVTSANLYPLISPLSQQNNRWDISVYLNMPIYSAGELKAKKDLSFSSLKTAEIELELAIRQAESEVRQAFEEARYSRLRTESIRDALISAKQNVQYQEEDYRLGLVTNLDVLNSMNDLLQLKISLSKAEAEEKILAERLRIVSGENIE
ncbi:MAG TPA: TolC family protein [Elusimicrobiales bacterium]|nr:TolC family protein [Elusimicrobiales bacterium]HOL62322.1 TolC family protein [Elusimicrobiales bacterium]HPO95571.1 TolC family protein [Elusimicrobiales bacterium]